MDRLDTCLRTSFDYLFNQVKILELGPLDKKTLCSFMCCLWLLLLLRFRQLSGFISQPFVFGSVPSFMLRDHLPFFSLVGATSSTRFHILRVSEAASMGLL